MKVLLATDGSAYSEGAARFLAGLRLSPEDEITVLHVVSWVPFNYDAESYQASFREIKKEIAPKILDLAIEILRPTGARISTAITDGSPERYIIEVAQKSGADMIVMGARGLKGLKTMIVGSVTKAVALNSAVPLLVTKLSPPRTGGLRILFATDGSEYSVATGRFLSDIPFPEDTEVTVLNVVWSHFSDIPERFVMEVDDRIKEIMGGRRSAEIAESAKILDEAARVLGGRFGKVEVMSRIGEPSAETLKAAEALGVDVIAVGSSGKRGVKGVMGSISRNVLNHAACSVLVGKTGK